MATAQVFEQSVHTRLIAVSVVDALLQAWRTAGEFPPPQGDVTCRVIEQTAPVGRTFTPPLLLVTVRNSSGFLMLDGSWAHEDRPERLLPLAPGSYTIRISGDYYQNADFVLDWPPPLGQTRVPIDPNPPNRPLNILLLPGSTYPLPDVTLSRLQLGPTILRGSLFSAAGDPLTGVKVELLNVALVDPPDLPPLGNWPFLAATTDERGGWTLVLPGRRYYDNSAEVPPPNAPPITRQLTIRINYPPPAAPLVLTPDVQLGTERSIPNTALRGQVVGPGGAPISGAVITTSASGAASVTRANGTWFLYFPLDFLLGQPDLPTTVTATTPSGASASDSTALVKHGATTFVPTFHFA